MNIKARIAARKIVLAYFYQRMFAQDYMTDKDISQDIETDKTGEIKFVGETKVLEEIMDSVKDSTQDLTASQSVEKINNFYKDETFLDDINAVINSGFSNYKEKDLIDFDYIKDVGRKYSEYKEDVKRKVNEHVETFQYQEMDLIDRAIFLIGYIENQELDTPVKVILNEMVELAKRYGDSGSGDLINGVGEKIIK